MLSLIAELGRVAASALAEQFPDNAAIPAELAVQPAAKPEFGDLQITGCLQLAKPLGQKPRDLAAHVVRKLTAHPDLAKVEIAGPGYVNLHLSSAYLERTLTALRSDPHAGLRQRTDAPAIVVDYSSPNIAKPMHIGHIRSTIIGDALARIFRALGHPVVADNHLGDWGTQFGKLIVAYRKWLDRDAYKQDPIAELVRLYQRFVSEEKQEAQALGLGDKSHRPDAAKAAAPEAGADAAGDDDDADGGDEPGQQEAVTPLLAAARAELAKLQQGDADNLALWREFVDVSLAVFDRTYKRLDVRFDTYHGESFYHPRLHSLVDELLAKGIAEPSRGAVICPVEGEPAPLLIRKADGSFLYGTTDLATIEYRVNTYHPARVLYLVGIPQQLHFRQVFAVGRKMGLGIGQTTELEHIPFGSMRFKDAAGNWSTGSTRQGNVPMLEEFLDEAIRRARAVAAQKNPDLPPAELDEVARVVGIGAIKYNDLSRDRLADIHFDIDKALALDGNTAPYIQYAYARLRSIARRAEEAGARPADTLTLRIPAERVLGRRLLDYPAIVEQAARTAKPHPLCEYLYELSGAVSTFYNDAPVLKAEPDERASRLLLLELAARTLRHGLGLLGIEVPERM